MIDWSDVLHTTIAAVPAVIAAISSLKNGRTLKNGTSHRLPRKKTRKGASKDWFKAPRLH